MTPVGQRGGGLGGRLAPPAGEPCPLPGSPPALVDAADSAGRAAARLLDSRTRLLRVRAALGDQRSTAVDRAVERVTASADGARACGGMLEAASATLRRHADALADAQAAARQALADRSDALDREARWLTEADDARRSTWNIAAAGGASAAPVPGFGGPAAVTAGAAWPGAPELPGDPASAHARLATAERELAAARADVAAAEARWRAARDAKDAASRQSAAALSSLADVRAVRAITAAGSDLTGLQASGAAARAAVALLPRAATGDASARHAVRADLRRVLTAHADDPAFWAVFWDSASPAQLYGALVDRRPGSAAAHAALGAGLGPELDAELARALGAGVGQWAQTASPEEQRDLGRRVVEEVAAVAASPLTPAGEAEVAAALLPPSLPAAVHAGADDALDAWWGGHAPLDGSFTVLAPVLVAVAGGLAAHPRLAFDRLAPADGSRTAGSVSRWLGSVPRAGWPDGGVAVAGAFSAAVEVGSTSTDRGDQGRAALLVSHATPALPRGLLLTPGLSDDAARSVALAYEPYVPVMGDAAATQGLTTSCPRVEPPPAPGTSPDAEAAPGFDELFPLVVQPRLDAFALRDVIGATSRTPEAAAAWLDVTDRYAATTLEHATSDVVDADVSTGAPLVRAALSDIGSVAGAMQAEAIEAAEAEVAAREAVVGLAGASVGYLHLGSKAVTEAVSFASVPALRFLDTEAPLHDAREAVRATEDALVDRYAPAMYEALIENERDLGRSAGERERLVGELDPSENGSDPAATFDQTFDTQSDPEEPCA